MSSVSNEAARVNGVRRRWLSVQQQDKLLTDYLSGVQIPELAERYSRDQSSVNAFLRRRCVPMRSRSECCRTYDLDEHAFDAITERSAYWVGVLMADGCVMVRPSGQHCLTLALAETDAAHVLAFRSFLGSAQPIRVQDNNKRGSVGRQPLHHLTVTSRHLAERLASFGVVPRKSKTARVIGLENDRHFWRGAVDGDGWVTFLGNGSPFTGLTGSRVLVEQFAAFVAPLIGKQPRVQPNTSVWKVSLTCLQAVAVVNALYAGAAIALPRKLAAAQEIARYGERRAARRNRRCEVLWCGRRHAARGLCQMHWKQVKRGHP